MKKTDKQLLEEYEKQQARLNGKVSKLKERIAKKEHERQFKIYKNVYDAMHKWFTEKGLTDDIIYDLDPKKELRECIWKAEAREAIISRYQNQNQEKSV